MLQKKYVTPRMAVSAAAVDGSMSMPHTGSVTGTIWPVTGDCRFGAPPAAAEAVLKDVSCVVPGVQRRCPAGEREGDRCEAPSGGGDPEVVVADAHVEVVAPVDDREVEVVDLVGQPGSSSPRCMSCWRCWSRPTVGRAAPGVPRRADTGGSADPDWVRAVHHRPAGAQQSAGREACAAGCSRIFSEKISTRIKVHPELEAALTLARDIRQAAPAQPVILTVHEMKRLARNAAELMTLSATLHAAGTQLELLTGPLTGIYDPGGMGAMLFAVLAVAAQLDREYIREKTLEGQQTAAAKGNHGGRPRGHAHLRLSATRPRRARPRDCLQADHQDRQERREEPPRSPRCTGRWPTRMSSLIREQ